MYSGRELAAVGSIPRPPPGRLSVRAAAPPAGRRPSERQLAAQTAEIGVATRDLFLAAYQAAVLQAFRDVEDALVAFSHEQASRTQLENAMCATQRPTDLARGLYAQGLTDFLTILVAEQSLFSASPSGRGRDAIARPTRRGDVHAGDKSLMVITVAGTR